MLLILQQQFVWGRCRVETIHPVLLLSHNPSVISDHAAESAGPWSRTVTQTNGLQVSAFLCRDLHHPHKINLLSEIGLEERMGGVVSVKSKSGYLHLCCIHFDSSLFSLCLQVTLTLWRWNTKSLVYNFKLVLKQLADEPVSRVNTIN